MLAGKLYDANYDPQLLAERNRAKDLLDGARLLLVFSVRYAHKRFCLHRSLVGRQYHICARANLIK